MKPVLDGSEEAKIVSGNVLYTCLDQGLKLLHPFMPFVTEELYQRLPNRPNETVPTIMLASFPTVVEDWTNSEAVSNFDYINSIIHACRSLATDYGVKSPNLYIQGPKTDLLESQKLTMQALIKNSSLTILSSDTAAPAGCTVKVLEESKILLLVKGIIDMDKELKKLNASLEKTVKQRDTIASKVSEKSYVLNVADNVKEIDLQKITGLEAEIQALTLTIQEFEKLK